MNQNKKNQSFEETRKQILKSRGLGDTIAKMTKAIGIKQCSGCKKRQRWLNEKIPFKKDSVDSSNNSE